MNRTLASSLERESTSPCRFSPVLSIANVTLVGVPFETETCHGMAPETVAPANGATIETLSLTLGRLAPAAAVANIQIATALRGSAAVDSDAADRILTVQWTMSVSNVNSEMSMDSATAELF